MTEQMMLIEQFDPFQDLIFQLEQHKLYETPDGLFAGHRVAFSAVIAKDIIDAAIDNVFETLHNKVLEAKQRPHEILSTLDLVERTTLNVILTYDAVEIQFPEDTEAMPTVSDNYCRNQIPSKLTHKPHLEQSFSKIVSDGPLMRSTIFRLTEDKGRERAKKHLVDINKEQVPEPIDLKDLLEDTALEDQLREAKQRNLKRATEEETQRKKLEEAMLEAKTKLVKLNADIRKKTYTFDYDGKIIMTKGTKADKLAPASYLVNYTVNSQTSEDQIKSHRSKIPSVTKINTNTKDISLARSKPKKVLSDDKELSKMMIVGPPAIFEDFRPKMGVKMMEAGRKKEGAKYTLSSPTFAASGLLSLSGANSYRLSKENKIRRDEYFQFVKGGNLSRQGMIGQTEETITSELGQTEPINSSKLSIQKNTLLDKSKFSVPKLKLPEELIASTVRVHSSRLAEIMNKQDEQPYSARLELKTKKSQTFKIDDSLQTNPVDNFNMNIISSKDWGRNITVSTSNYTPLPFPKGEEKLLSHAVGIKPKYPRERQIRHPSGASSTLVSPRSITRDTYIPF